MRGRGAWVTLRAGLATPALAPAARAEAVADPAADVNPLIGSTASGDTFPGATLPFGMLKFSPVTATGNLYSVSGASRDTYGASTTADVTSTAGNAALTVDGPAHLSNGGFTLRDPLQVEITPSTWSGPVSHAPVATGFHQHIGATGPLRSGAYSTTLTFTLSTTAP